jgi:prepilin-type N-terminal cleavage/methylation domain-containing protein
MMPCRCSPQVRRPRRGFTLLELIIAMTAVAVILAVTTMLMHFVLEMNAEVRQRTQTVTTVGRLAEQFRSDAHRSIGEPTVAADHRAIEFHLPGGKVIKWQADARGLTRSAPAADRGPGGLAAMHEDSYALPSGTTAALELQSQGAARIATIRIDSPGSRGPSLAIEALAARDGRMAIEEESL